MPLNERFGPPSLAAESEQEALRQELEQREAGWSESKGLGLTVAQYVKITPACARGWLYLEGPEAIQGNGCRGGVFKGPSISDNAEHETAWELGQHPGLSVVKTNALGRDGQRAAFANDHSGHAEG